MRRARTAAVFAAGAALLVAAGVSHSQNSPGADAAEELRQPETLTINREVGAVRELTLEAGQNRLLILSEPIGRVSVADPSIADLKVITQTQLLLTARQVGGTDMTVWTKKDEPLVVALQVLRNLAPLRKQLADLFPGEKIEVSTTGDMVVLTGEVTDIRLPKRIAEVAQLHAEKVANLVRVSGDQQVQLEVKFAEVSRTALREMGMSFFHKGAGYATNAGVMSSRTPSGSFAGVPSVGTSGPLGAAGGHPPEVPAQAFGDAFSLFFSNYNYVFPFSLMLSMLESRGLAKILAEPTLVALSGQEAKFLAGGEIPIPTSSSLGQVSVSWKEFGVVLRFTPTVVSKGAMHLKVYTEVSDIDNKAAITVGGYTIPGLISRQGETTVRLNDGQSFAVAGLMSDTVRSQVDRLPGLGHVPILGALFSSTQWKREETELLVIVTARLARPLAPHDVPPLPTDYEDYDVGAFNLFFMGWDAVARDDSSTSHRSSTDTDTDTEGRGPSGAVGFSN